MVECISETPPLVLFSPGCSDLSPIEGRDSRLTFCIWALISSQTQVMYFPQNILAFLIIQFFLDSRSHYICVGDGGD